MKPTASARAAILVALAANLLFAATFGAQPARLLVPADRGGAVAKGRRGILG